MLTIHSLGRLSEMRVLFSATLKLEDGRDVYCYYGMMGLYGLDEFVPGWEQLAESAILGEMRRRANEQALGEMICLEYHSA